MTGFKHWAWRYIPGAHPGIDRLILWADGVPSPELEPHLARCAECSGKAKLLRAAIAVGKGKQPGDDRADRLLHEVFDRLQVQMRAWRSLSGSQQHWVNALEFYFGKEMARQAGDDPTEMATTSLLHAFLGRKAGDAVVRRIAGAAL
jgi:hypothetical protein